MKITQAGAFYTSQMTSFPVIHLTLQEVKGLTLKDAYEMLISLIQELYDEHHDFLDSDHLSLENKRYFQRVWIGRDPVTGERASIADDKRSP